MNIDASKESPMVNITENAIIIEGVCMPENALEFFTPIHSKVESVVASSSELEVSLFFTYLNSTSNKHILKILKAIEKKFPKQIIKWSFKSKDRLMKMKAQELNKFCPQFVFELNEVA